MIQVQPILLKTWSQFGQNEMLYSKYLLKIFHRTEITLARCLAQLYDLGTTQLVKNTASIWSKMTYFNYI